jgi:hypothetical protein
VDGEGSWALQCSIYLHLNPVRIQSLGLEESARVAERAGTMPAPPEREMIERRLATLRSYRWSSYPAYAGYAGAPEWLTRTTLWKRTAKKPEEAPDAYRRWIEDYLRQGVEEGTASRLTQALAIGSAAFVEKLRRRMSATTGARTNARAWRRLLGFREVAQAVESEVGAAWADFGSRRGDERRDLVLYLGRTRGGMTLAELARHAGMSLDTVAKAVKRLQTRLPRNRPLRARLGRIEQALAGRQADL